MNVVISLAVSAVLFLHAKGDDFREDRFIANASDYCQSCHYSCEEYSFSAEEYARFETILAQELNSNNLLKSGWEQAKSLGKSHSLLTENEVLAVVTYTLDVPKVYEMFNNMTRTRGIKSDTYFYKGMHFFLSSAVHKLSTDVPQSTFRCESGPMSLPIGSFFSFKQFASSTTDYYQAIQLGPFCLHLITLRGAPISSLSAFPQQKEILIPSCETFEVVPIEEGYRFYAKMKSTGGLRGGGNGSVRPILHPTFVLMLLMTILVFSG